MLIEQVTLEVMVYEICIVFGSNDTLEMKLANAN